MTKHDQLSLLAAPGLLSPQYETLHARFEQQALLRPDATAASCNGDRLSYAELNAKANQLAHVLRASGAVPDSLVAVYLDRSLDLLVALLGVLKAGAAYLPLDPSYPPERLAFMIEDTGAPLLLTQRRFLPTLPKSHARTICIDDASAPVWNAPRTNPSGLTAADDLAYVIYTSGSTGTPKGVAISHRNVLRLFDSTKAWFEPSDKDVWTLFHSYAFDFFVWEMWGALLYGGRAVVVPYSTSRAPLDFYRLLSEQGVTVLNQTPSAFAQLSAAEEASGCALPLALRLVIFGGEALDMRSLEPWFNRHGDCGPQLINMYGITETTVHVTHYRLSKDDCSRGSVIGIPIPDLTLHLLDERQKPVPDGLPGEIFVGGAGLARGYLNRPELTAERFIRDPFSLEPGARLYRTGDCARRLPDGNYEYLRRLDLQVKIRGFRIELGEIESVLNEHPAIESSVVNARRDGTGQNSLWAYVVTRGGSLPPSSDLKAFLAKRLPDYMMPAGFSRVNRWPLTANGKLDRNGLPPPHSTSTAEAGEASTPEDQILGFCREILAYPDLGPNEPLLDAGFHSLAYAQLAWRICKRFGVTPLYSELFEQRTVANLARLVQARRGLGAAELEPLTATDREGPLPLSFSQERIWFLEKLNPCNLAYHFQAIFRFYGKLDIGALEQALNLLVERHEILRTSFPDIGGRPVQRIHPFAPFTIPVEDVDVPRAEQRIAAIIREPFDLEQTPPLRWILFRIGAEEHWLLHMQHHLLHDGAEYEVFLREFFEAYDSLAANRAVILPPLTVQFADFAAWQRRQLASGCWDRQLDYWEKRLQAPPPPTQLPTIRPRESEQTFAGAQIRQPLQSEFYAELRAAAAKEGVTPYMWLHAAYQAFLFRYTGQTDLIVGTGIANRQSAESRSLLGMIINTAALRVSISGQLTFRELLTRVRQALLEALDNQDVPFDHVVRRVGSGSVSFNTFFDTYDNVYPSYRSDVLRVEREDVVNNGTCKFDLVTLVIQGEAGTILLWEYNTDLFSAEVAQRMLHHFLTLLKASVADPGRPVGVLPMLSCDERTDLIATCSRQRSSARYGKRLDDLFAGVAALQPEAPAAVCGGQHVTYCELDERADALAKQLRACGAHPGEAIAFVAERGIQALSAMLAILKSECAYLPLDPALPKGRQQTLLDTAGVRLVVNSDGNVSARGRPVGSPDPMLRDAAYVLFTSGSTGAPKAVCVPHCAVVRLVSEVDYASLTVDTRFLQLAPLSFDASTLEIWGPLLNGGTVVVQPEDMLSFDEIGCTIAHHQVTTAWLTASLFNQVIDTSPEILRPLRELLTGGEALSVPHVVRALTALPDTALVNGYGPTEATTFATTFKIPRDFDPNSQRLPIGRPLPDTQVYVLNEQREVVPYGVRGEIYIGGAGLALGYLGDAELTAAKFVPDTITDEPGARLYRTGDIARLLPDGNLDFVGRLDRQVKVRGFRIEPREIEVALAQHPGIREAATTVWKNETANRQLVAYVVAKPGHQARDFHRFLSEQLPAYMVPARIVVVDQLPLTSSGKVDHHALPPPDHAAFEPAETRISARTPTEAVLAGIWANTLGVEQVGANDDFFELGGHSLLALQLMHATNSTFGVDLPLRLLFNDPTLAGQAREIERALAGANEAKRALHPLVVPLRAGGSKHPFFLVAGGFGGEAELLVYAGLGRHLDAERPFYGLRIPGVDDLIEPGAAVEEMAAEHVTEIRKVQPHGPYFIGGSCVGGVVALEIAQQLSAQGEDVASLILIDSYFPNRKRLLRNRLRLWRQDAMLCVGDVRRESFLQLRARLKSRITAAFTPSPERRLAAKKTRIGRGYIRRLLRYNPCPYYGPITLIVCEGQSARDPAWMWRDVARAGLDIQYVPGDHFTHLREHAAATATRLDSCLEVAQGRFLNVALCSNLGLREPPVS